MNLRCFIAIDISVQTRNEIGELIDILRECNGDIKWVMPENVHVTLKFLGETAEDMVPKISASLSAVTASYKPFSIKIHGTGVFPNRKNPRVIWVGLEDSEMLKGLNDDIENAVSSFGYRKEDKEFRPHLTIGRVRSRRGMITVVNELDNFKERDFGELLVDRIKFMKSELRPKGAEYTCLLDLAFESN
jgi:RNA 2',3'-cyclic 3'-phosphodiesterase